MEAFIYLMKMRIGAPSPEVACFASLSAHPAAQPSHPCSSAMPPSQLVSVGLAREMRLPFDREAASPASHRTYPVKTPKERGGHGHGRDAPVPVPPSLAAR